MFPQNSSQCVHSVFIASVDPLWIYVVTISQTDICCSYGLCTCNRQGSLIFSLAETKVASSNEFCHIVRFSMATD